MINIEHVREMCCNLQQQQLKISETYNELINSLKLEDKIDQLNKELNSSKLVIQSLTNKVKAQEAEILSLKSELGHRNGIIRDMNGQLVAKDKDISELKEELENTKNIGNVILNLHNQQFRKLSKNIDAILYYLEHYNKNKRANLDRIYSTVTETKVDDMSSLQLLIEVNNKFVKLGINIMKLFSNLDYNLFYNYNSNCNTGNVGYNNPHFDLNSKKLVQFHPKFNSNYKVLVRNTKSGQSNPNKGRDQERDNKPLFVVNNVFNSDNLDNKDNLECDLSKNSDNFESNSLDNNENEVKLSLDKYSEDDTPNLQFKI